MKDYSFIDLHIHTTYSKEPGCDDTIEDVFKDAQKIAERSGKDCLIAITDHNTVLGVPEARRLAESGKYDKVKLVSGCEFSVDMSEVNSIFGGGRVFRKAHILAYGFDENHPDIVAFSKKASFGSSSLKYSQLVDLIKKAGGYIVIAHPGLLKVNPKAAFYYQGTEHKEEILSIAQHAKSDTILRNVPNGMVLFKVFYEKLQKMSGGLLVGMERFHPDNYHREFNDELGKFCDEHGLVQTAGSDFHGLHLHEHFSVGNPFTDGFQDYYKETLNDCTQYRNGIHVSYLPGIELLTGEKTTPGNEVKMISGNGEPITYDQYKIVNDAYQEEKRKKKESERKNQPVKNNNNNGNHKKKHKHKHHGKKHRGNQKYN